MFPDEWLVISSFYLTAGSDYETGPYTVTFTAGQMLATLMVSTTDDNTTELAENFMVVINSTNQTDRTTIGSPNTAFVTIEDNDPGTYIYVYTHPAYVSACYVHLNSVLCSFKQCGVCACMMQNLCIKYVHNICIHMLLW